MWKNGGNYTHSHIKKGMSMLNKSQDRTWFELPVWPDWKGKTLAELFRNEWESPKKLTHQFRMEKKVLLNGSEADWNVPLQPGSTLKLQLFEEELIQFPPSHVDVPVLFEDEHCLIVNKPPFMATHPNDPKSDTNTLVNAVMYHMKLKGERQNIRQVHRLDRDTSGAVLFGKHALAGAILDRKLEKREIKRTYIAIVQGLLNQNTGIIDKPIGRDRHHPTRRRVSPTGQPAVTRFEVIKQDPKENITYVKCWLDTGRTHQIRVHFSSIGHPLLGDELYGGKKTICRQALHAAKLSLIHPFTLEKIDSYAPFIDKPPIFKDIDLKSL